MLDATPLAGVPNAPPFINTTSQAAPSQYSRNPVVVLILVYPVRGAAGLSAVVPLGSWTAPVPTPPLATSKPCFVTLPCCGAIVCKLVLKYLT